MDGNARVKRGIAAMVTTFGVGELSALNGIGEFGTWHGGLERSFS